MLVAALLAPAGAPAEIVRHARDGLIEIVVSPHLLSELAEVLTRERFRRYCTLDEASEYVEGLARLAITVSDPPAERGMTRDPDDDYLVTLARVAGADALVSGDLDLLDAAIEPRAVTPAAFVARLAQRT